MGEGVTLKEVSYGKLIGVVLSEKRKIKAKLLVAG